MIIIIAAYWNAGKCVNSALCECSISGETTLIAGPVSQDMFSQIWHTDRMYPVICEVSLKNERRE